jgi:hypothetical protein
MLVKLIAKPLNRCLLQPSCYETFVANTVLFGSQTIKTPPDL